MSLLASLTETEPQVPIYIPTGAQSSLFDTASISSLTVSSINGLPPGAGTGISTILNVSTMTVNPSGTVFLQNNALNTSKLVGYLDAGNTQPVSFGISRNLPNVGVNTMWMPQVAGVPTKLGVGSLYVYGESLGYVGPVPQITTNTSGQLNINSISSINFSTNSLLLNGVAIGLSSFNTASISTATISSINGVVPGYLNPNLSVSTLNALQYVNCSTITTGSLTTTSFGASPGITIASGGNLQFVGNGSILGASTINGATLNVSSIQANAANFSTYNSLVNSISSATFSTINGIVPAFTNPDPLFSTVTVAGTATVLGTLTSPLGGISSLTCSTINGFVPAGALPQNITASTITLGLGGSINFPNGGSIGNLFQVNTYQATFSNAFAAPGAFISADNISGNLNVTGYLTGSQLNALYPNFYDFYLMNNGAFIQNAGFMDTLSVNLTPTATQNLNGIFTKSYITIKYSLYGINLDINNNVNLVFTGSSEAAPVGVYQSATVSIGVAQSLIVPRFQVVEGQMTLLQGVNYKVGDTTLRLGVNVTGGTFSMNNPNFQQFLYSVPTGNTWRISAFG